jgi:inward rectifier potassium channel
MPLGWFLLSLTCFFLIINAVFAVLYLSVGQGELSDMPQTSWLHQWEHAFFFSSQTITTVGYGHISPTGFAASILASMESFMGLLLFALISGLSYARFSRPKANLKFSDQMLVAPYQDGRGLMFRMVNPYKSELIEVEVAVSLAINQRDDQTGAEARRFYPLELEISKIAFFPLSWTLVHALNEKSPMFGWTAELLKEGNAEIMILVKGVDEATQQTVHARRSYIADEIVWDAQFEPIMSKSKDLTRTVIHTRKVSQFKRLSPN